MSFWVNFRATEKRKALAATNSLNMDSGDYWFRSLYVDRSYVYIEHLCNNVSFLEIDPFYPSVTLISSVIHNNFFYNNNSASLFLFIFILKRFWNCSLNCPQVESKHLPILALVISFWCWTRCLSTGQKASDCLIWTLVDVFAFCTCWPWPTDKPEADCWNTWIWRTWTKWFIWCCVVKIWI